MAKKGSTRKERACKALAIDGYPGAIPLSGMVSLLSGMDDDNAPDWQEWASMVWDSFYPDDRWESSKLQRVELLIRTIEPAAAADWLTENGETPDTLSEQVKLWLRGHLDAPGKPRLHRQRRLDLLKQVVERLKGNDSSLNTQAMPGTRGELLEHCQRLHSSAFAISERTFAGDVTDICNFPDGARKSGYYLKMADKLT